MEIGTYMRRNSTFELIIRDKSGSRVTYSLPIAYSVESRNLDKNETKIIRYRDIDIRGGDSVIANPICSDLPRRWIVLKVIGFQEG